MIFFTAVEKIIQGVFPEAQVQAAKDYNIFNPTGAAVGAALVLRPNQFYPVRSYQKLEGDPMKAITNVFTKLAKNGEGAALQIVITPAARKWQRMLKTRARRIFKGEPEHKNALNETVKVIGGVVGGQTPPADDPLKKNQQMEMK